MRLSVIIPVYNEEQTIHEVLVRVAAVDLGPIDMEIVVVNDGSTDGTRPVIDERRLPRQPQQERTPVQSDVPDSFPTLCLMYA
jgi:glycosyltransferase involved in cell wall biosynthesis